MTEADIMRDIQVRMTNLGHRVFRNNTGSLEDKTGRWVKFGLYEGSSDLIGWTKKGRFLAIEVKAPGSRTNVERLKKQSQFLEAVNDAGGIGIFATSADDAAEKLIALE